MIGIIGIILLIGIVKKNGIMLVDFAIVAERERNMPPLAAIREACLLRFRPILMTTAAAMLAGVPMMFGHGTGSEMRHPLGYSMVGGLALSQVLTLYTTPGGLSLPLPLAGPFAAPQVQAGVRARRGPGHRGGVRAAIGPMAAPIVRTRVVGTPVLRPYPACYVRRPAQIPTAARTAGHSASRRPG